MPLYCHHTGLPFEVDAFFTHRPFIVADLETLKLGSGVNYCLWVGVDVVLTYRKIAEH